MLVKHPIMHRTAPHQRNFQLKMSTVPQLINPDVNTESVYLHHPELSSSKLDKFKELTWKGVTAK